MLQVLSLVRSISVGRVLSFQGRDTDHVYRILYIIFIYIIAPDASQ